MKKNKPGSAAGKFTLDKIKITFDYNLEKVSYESEPFKSLKKLKDKAITHFFQCPKNIQCFYLNKDITPNENEQIGILFLNKKNVEIKLKGTYNINKEEKTKSKNVISSVFSKESDLKAEEEKPESLNEYSYRRLISQIKDEELMEKSNKLIESIKTGNKATDTNSISAKSDKAYSSLINSLSSNISNLKKNENLDNFLCECKKQPAIIYCRDCNKLLCIGCIEKGNHQYHIKFNVEPSSIELSLKKYQAIILDEINKRTTILDKKKTQNKKAGSLSGQNKKIKNKITSLYEQYEKIIQAIEEKKKSNEIKTTDIDKYKTEYTSNCNKIKNEINTIISGVKDNESNSCNKEEFIHYFDLINKAEAQLNNNTSTDNNVTLFKMLNDLEYRIEGMNEKLLSAYNEATQGGILEKLMKELNIQKREDKDEEL